MATVSSFDFWIPILCVLIVWIGLCGGFKGRAMIATALVVLALTDGVVVNGLKHIVNRPRPTQVDSVRVVDLQKAKPRLLAVFKPVSVRASHPSPGMVKEGRSFPSGHTTDNFAIATVLTVFYPRRGWLYFFASALVGYSRIYTGSHWPTDVIASAFLGVSLALFFLAVVELVWRKVGDRVTPVYFAEHPSLFLAARTHS
jgi:undecaprenyl-diphosphatase